MVRARAQRALSAAVALAVSIPGAALAQGPTDRYLDHDGLTAAARDLVERHGGLAGLTSLARTDQGRDVWLLTLGSDEGRPLNQRPALLLVANLEGNRIAGSSAALAVAERLLEAYGQDEAATEILDERTIYIVPRANPDGAELAFTMPGYEITYKPHAAEPEAGGLNARERGRDLNGDGLVTLMRMRDPEGRLMPEPDEPRVLREAERARAERGVYRVLVEGIDTASVEAYVAMGTDGVNLNRNFQHEYLYFQPHVGPHMVSEVESRALVDFVYEHPNIAAVLTWSAYDNLRAAPPERRTVPEGVTGNPPNVPTTLDEADHPYFAYVSERFRDLTGLSGRGASGEAGSFAQFAYYQMGLPSFTTPVWTLPSAEGGGGAGAGGGGSDAADDARWLAHFDSAGIDGFVAWEAATHPELGEVEVGGFRPNARVNPPPAELAALTGAHADFVTWLAGQLPEVEVVDTSVEARGDGIWLVSTTLANESYFPTQLAMGERIRFNRRVTVRVMPADGMTVLSSNTQEQFTRLDGMGGRSTHTWLVQAPAGTRITLEVHAERAGGLQSIPVTLR